MAIDIPARLRDEDFATCLVKRYLAPDLQRAEHATPAHTSSGSAEAGTGPKSPTSSPPRTCSPSPCSASGSRDTTHCMSSTTRPASSATCSPRSRSDIALQDPDAEALIAEDGPAWKLWDAIRDIEPRPEDDRIGPVAAGKLLARKRPRPAPRLRQPHQEGPQKAPHRQLMVARPARASSSMTTTSSTSSSQFAPGQTRATCPCSASST